MKPSVELNKTMYLVSMKTNEIHAIFCTHESKTSESVLTDYGKVLRTNTKHQKIFYQYDFALLQVKESTGETDDEEYNQILKRLKLKKTEKSVKVIGLK